MKAWFSLREELTIPAERWFLRVWEPAASEAHRPQPGMCLQRWNTKAVRERREGRTWKEHNMYKDETDMQNNKRGEEQIYTEFVIGCYL